MKRMKKKIKIFCVNLHNQLLVFHKYHMLPKMKLHAYSFFILLIISTTNSFAQLSKEDKLDSLRAKFVADSSHIFREKEVNSIIALDGRNSFLVKNPVNVQGIQLGFSSGRIAFGVGFYSILEGLQRTNIVGEGKDLIIDSTKVGYFTFFYQYTFISTKRWQVSSLLEAGGGGHTTIHIDYKDSLRPNKIINTGTFIPISAGVDASFKIFYWIGFDIMAGYRVAFTSDKNFNFNGFYYSYGMDFYLGEVIKRFKLHEKKGQYGHDISMLHNPPPGD